MNIIIIIIITKPKKKEKKEKKKKKPTDTKWERKKEVLRNWKVNHINIHIHIHISDSHSHPQHSHQTIFMLCISAIVLAIATIIDAVFELESRDFGGINADFNIFNNEINNEFKIMNLI